MVEKQYTISASEGLHARPTSLLVGSLAPFSSDISLIYNDKTVNMKSILGVMALGVASGATITVRAEGADENEAIAKIDEVMKSEGLAN
ncbi:phosphocarrier protein HPr [Bhargavaea ginsengi]|uniref:phosphocarrier protein HPr n=1 Tax=Bhargavaea ginsengi TaxID=426757 RepID=UPI00203E0676|nr:phosphocarrier protein HPr [Bhargavaea ginsengi]MCM3086858.1 phosphocarrier protein HPr [Bhargavaea ginsengi]